MKLCSCGLSVKRTPTKASLFFVAKSCHPASSAIGRPSPFEPGTRMTTARTLETSPGSHRRNSALSKLLPGGTVSSMVKPAANEIVETDNTMRRVNNPKPRLDVIMHVDGIECQNVFQNLTCLRLRP